MDVSRSAYLGGRMAETESTCVVGIQWYMDKGASIPIGGRQFTLSSLIVGQMSFRLPNMGPFAQMNFTAIAGGQYTASARVIGTDRVHPLEFIPGSPRLLSLVNAPIGAGSNQLQPPQEYYAGPALVSAFATVAGMQIITEWVDLANNVETVDVVVLAASTWTRWSTVTPPGAWSMGISNPGAAGAYHLSVIPSMTGAT